MNEPDSSLAYPHPRMLESTRKHLLDSIDDAAAVLDIGGWADPFARANWVIDLMPYETRGMYEREGWVGARQERERFTRDTWIVRDLCSHEPYPFGDDEFDFVICAQTLEDLRDPIWVCHEINRIGKAGYIEVPSRLEEQSWGVAGPFVGWSHHRWLIDISDGRINFSQKLHSIHARPDQHFPAGFWHALSEEERIQTLRWEGTFAYGERITLDAEESNRYLSDFVTRELAKRKQGQVPAKAGPSAIGKARRLAGGLRARARQQR